MKIFNHKTCQFVLLLAVTLGLATGCKEEIDMSDRYTVVDETILTFLENENLNQDRFSEYLKLINEVTISRNSKSTVAQLLSARGHFTCFAPNNKAIQLYLDSLYRKGIITSASWEGFEGKPEALDSIQKVIVYNSIINSGDRNDATIYEIANFPNPGIDLEVANMNDRKLTVEYNDIDSIYIEGVLINPANRDVKTINGRVHEVEGVIAPSNETVADILQTWIKEGGSKFCVMANLAVACGLTPELAKQNDEEWEELVKTMEPLPFVGNDQQITGDYPIYRKYGFTIFAETDDIWETAIGKQADDITLADIKKWLIDNHSQHFPGATTDDDFTNENNIVNQFVTYHILPMCIPSDRLVIHYNERGYNPDISTGPTIPVEEFYQTLGKHRLLKIYESAESQGVYLNRFPVLRNGRGRFSPENEDINDYKESGDFKDISGASMRTDENVGAKILLDNVGESQTTKVLNGMIYPIDNFLVYTENVQNQLMRQRIRIDCSAMFPEFMNNDMRGLKKEYQGTHWNRMFPRSKDYRYFEGLYIGDETNFYYLPGRHSNWHNYQGDEFNVVNKYEMIMKLPPVPKASTYEIRYGIIANSNRGMCQVYWGEDENNLPAMGIPLDLRMTGTVRYTRRGTGNSVPSIVGWKSDADLGNDQDLIDENDKLMRNNGFMKGSFAYTNSKGSTIIRNFDQATRRIIVRAWMEPEKTYYIKFKSVLDDDGTQFYMDYLEWCAKEVYDNPMEMEDIW